MAVYVYERPFRLKLLSLMLDTLWMFRYGSELIQAEYFEQEDEEAVAKGIIDFRKAYNKIPRDPDDVVALTGPKYAELVYKVFDLYEQGDLELARDKALEFAKQQAVKLAVLDSVDDIEHGNLDSPIARLKDALRVGDSIISPGIDPIADVDSWLYAYWQDKVRTGLHHLDRLLEGGLGWPELGVILSPPNQGKSLALINIGYGAASLGSAVNVVHFTNEMKPAQVCKRYAARMVFRFPKRDEDLQVYEDELMAAARRVCPGHIRVIGGASCRSLIGIRTHLDKLIAEGFKPGLIIEDYADLLEPPKHYNERRFELSAIYHGLREISEDYQLPVWTASQAGRQALSKEIITMADIAEDIGKAAIADIIVALCQTYDESKLDQARLYLAKARDSSRKVDMIACKYYGDCQALVTVGYVERKKKGDEKDA